MTIKELRKEKGMTLAEFAKSLGIGMSTLTAYEAGKREPNAKTLAAVKDVYGVELAAAAPAAESAPAVEAAPAAPAKKEKKAPTKKAAAPKVEKPAPKAEEAKAEPKAAAEKPAKKTPAKKEAKAPAKKGAKAAKTSVVIIQSPMGGEITPEEILSRVGDVDRVYVRIDQNAAFWTKGEESGAINLW